MNQQLFFSQNFIFPVQIITLDFAFDDKARIFLLVDLREIFFRFRVGGTKKKKKKKALKMISR